MGGFIVRRFFSAIPILFGVVTIVFFLLHLTPGDPVDMMLGETALPSQRVELRQKLHLDEPLSFQYGRYLQGVVRGDLGTSIWRDEPVSVRIRRAYPATIYLASTAMLVGLAIALPAGLFAAIRKNTLWDAGAMVASLIGLSMPAFWMGPLLILVFAYHFGWFPVSGREGFLSVVLPALTLGAGLAAILARMTRAAMIETLSENYIQTAWAKGLPARLVFWKHALRNALIPILTVAGLQIGALLAGSIVTEKVFSWPGIGLELVEAIERRDYPVVQGCVIVISVSYVFINLLTDLIYGWIDPRIRYAKGSSS